MSDLRRAGKRPAPDDSNHFEYTSTELEAMEAARNYHRWIAACFAPYLGEHIVEVGAGIGTFTTHLMRTAPSASLTLFEPAANLVPRLHWRFQDSALVTVIPDLFQPEVLSRRPDTVVAVNVLEHLDDDEHFLHQVRRTLTAEGHLLLFVPALPWLFGSLDIAFGHRRRYARDRLRELLSRTGFEIVLLRYMNLPGVMAWWISTRILRSRTLRRAAVHMYDSAVIPWLSRIESMRTPPLGQSLIAIARPRTEIAE